MGKTAYPTRTEVEALLSSAGIAIGTLNTADATLAAINAFENAVGRKMLAPAGTATRYYDPPTGPDGFLDLRADLAVLTSVVYQPRGASAETLVQNTDFWLYPLNADSDPEPFGGPFLALEFASPRRWTAPLRAELHRAVQVTGRWGRATAIPEDAWWAMLVCAANLVAVAAQVKLSGGLIRTESSGVSTLYGDGPASPTAWARREWQEDFEAAVRRYRRITL